jgi:hypothetical protein
VLLGFLFCVAFLFLCRKYTTESSIYKKQANNRLIVYFSGSDAVAGDQLNDQGKHPYRYHSEQYAHDTNVAEQHNRLFAIQQYYVLQLCHLG